MVELAEWLRWAAQALALLAEAIGAVVVAVALVGAMAHYARDLIGRVEPFPRERIRLGVGRSLALALEFLLAADILRTAVEPTWDEIARLAAIAAIRTTLNFFLDREIRQEERRLSGSGGQEGGGEGGHRASS